VRKIVAAVAALAASSLLIAGENRKAQSLSGVSRVFVASFGAAEGANLIRECVINRMANSGRFSLAQSPDQADATLTGTAEVKMVDRSGASISWNQQGGHGSASKSVAFISRVILRLVGTEQQILWAGEAEKRSFFRPTDAKAAEAIVKKLLNDADKQQKRNGK
jgi:hypothetical protein